MKSVHFAAAFISLALAGAVARTSLAQAAPGVGESIAKFKVDAVTVYRGQALVTRAVDLPAGGGLAELVVTELPERVISASIFAEGSEGVEVRSVRYRERAVPPDVREEVRKIDEATVVLNDKIAANQKQMQVLQEQRTYLDKLESFAAPTATVEMTKGVLNADQLKTLTTFQFDTRQKIAKDELTLAQEARTLQEQSSLLARQRNELAIENFGAKAADVRLMDRIPVGKETDVRVGFDEAEMVKVSTDKEYLQAERRKGILRWDAQVPAQKNGSEAFALTYKLHLEHDKTLAIATSGVLSSELFQLLTQ